MIVKTEEEFLFCFDVGRPDLDPESLSYDCWRRFHMIIEDCEIPIKVNQAWPFIRGLLKENKGYLGSGMQYCFWFKTLEDRELTAKRLENAIPEFNWKCLRRSVAE